MCPRRPYRQRELDQMAQMPPIPPRPNMTEDMDPNHYPFFPHSFGPHQSQKGNQATGIPPILPPPRLGVDECYDFYPYAYPPKPSGYPFTHYHLNPYDFNIPRAMPKDFRDRRLPGADGWTFPTSRYERQLRKQNAGPSAESLFGGTDGGNWWKGDVGEALCMEDRMPGKDGVEGWSNKRHIGGTKGWGGNGDQSSAFGDFNWTAIGWGADTPAIPSWDGRSASSGSNAWGASRKSKNVKPGLGGLDCWNCTKYEKCINHKSPSPKSEIGPWVTDSMGNRSKWHFNEESDDGWVPPKQTKNTNVWGRGDYDSPALSTASLDFSASSNQNDSWGAGSLINSIGGDCGNEGRGDAWGASGWSVRSNTTRTPKPSPSPTTKALISSLEARVSALELNARGPNVTSHLETLGQAILELGSSHSSYDKMVDSFLAIVNDIPQSAKLSAIKAKMSTNRYKFNAFRQEESELDPWTTKSTSRSVSSAWGGTVARSAGFNDIREGEGEAKHWGAGSVAAPGWEWGGEDQRRAPCGHCGFDGHSEAACHLAIGKGMEKDKESDWAAAGW